MNRSKLSREVRIGLASLGSFALFALLVSSLRNAGPRPQIAHADRVITRELYEPPPPPLFNQYVGEPHDMEHTTALNKCMNDNLDAWRHAQTQPPVEDATSRKLLEIVTTCRRQLFGPNSVRTLQVNPSTAVPLFDGGLWMPVDDANGGRERRHIMAVHECMKIEFNSWAAATRQWTVDQQREKFSELSSHCEAWLR